MVELYNYLFQLGNFLYSTVSALKRFENLNPRDSNRGFIDFIRLDLVRLKIEKTLT